MSTSRQEAREEAYYARQDRNAHRCQCGDLDWPGACPGPANCPCCQSDCDDEVNADANAALSALAEPTEAMLDAGEAANISVRDAWDAMIDAAGD